MPSNKVRKIPKIEGSLALLNKRSINGAIFAVVCLCACSNGDAPVFTEPTTQPAAIVFEGQVDPKFVGKWATKDQNSKMELRPDGTATMENVAPGRGTSKTDGEWKLNGENLLIKLNNSTDHISRYATVLKGDTLTLEQKSTRLKVDYLRVK